MFRLGWFSTGRDEAARKLLKVVWDRIAEGFIPAEMAYVFVSRRPGESRESDLFFELCEKLGLKTYYLSAKEFEPGLRQKDRERWRTLYHQALYDLISREKTDLVVLAGYMWVVSADLCQRLPMINLHPALPGGPQGTWQEVIWQLLEKGATETGVMMHLVTPELDRGPAVTFCRFPIRGPKFDPLWQAFEEKLAQKGLQAIQQEEGEKEPLFALIREEGIKRELPLIVYTIKAFAEGEVKLAGEKLLDAQGRPLPGPYDLSERIERHLLTGEW